MRMATLPSRVDPRLYDDAQQAAAQHSRSTAQQINHWARIGQQLEAARQTTHDAVEQVLAGRRTYDALTEEAQAVVRATWDERIEHTVAGLDFTSELEKAGIPWAESDEPGRLVSREAARTRCARGVDPGTIRTTVASDRPVS